MPFNAPRLEIHPDRIAGNARSVIAACHAHGGTVACVTKAVCAHPAVVRAMVLGGADMIADSRLENLEAVAGSGLSLPRLLLRLPAPSQALEVVRRADVSLHSSLEGIRCLSEAARSLDRRHQVILMVDLGDLREGVWPDRAMEVLQGACRLPHIEVLGLGCNLACFSGVVPTVENMEALAALRDQGRRLTGLELATLSGGNSSSLALLASGRLPKAINHFRLGESILLGRDVLDRTPLPGTRQDAFRMVAEVVEVERKPSMPVGVRRQNAFGEIPACADRGIRLRAILNVGRQDVAVDGLTPELPGVTVLGGSSDHLVLDVEDAPGPVRLGDELAFQPGYGALLALATSPFVRKVVLA